MLLVVHLCLVSLPLLDCKFLENRLCFSVHLVQCLAHNGCLKSICIINKWIKKGAFLFLVFHDIHSHGFSSWLSPHSVSIFFVVLLGLPPTCPSQITRTHPWWSQRPWPGFSQHSVLMAPGSVSVAQKYLLQFPTGSLMVTLYWTVHTQTVPRLPLVSQVQSTPPSLILPSPMQLTTNTSSRTTEPPSKSLSSSTFHFYSISFLNGWNSFKAGFFPFPLPLCHHTSSS